MTFWLLALGIAVALVACGASPDGPGASDASSTEPSPSLRASLRPSDVSPSPRSRGGDELSGTLGADSVEGGCAYLESDGQRYEVIYPEGWTITAAPLELRDPSGALVAGAGDVVRVRGAEASDMASICQIGPIFRATEVVSVDR